jgi:capsular polysaccharide biosynthesis protein
MITVIPRVSLLEASGLEIDKYVTNTYRHPFQHETRAVLGLEEARILEVEPPFEISAEYLAVPSLPPTRASRWVCEFLRNLFLGSSSPSDKNRIYVSRSNAIGRRLGNQEQTLEVLAAFGFREFIPDEVSVREQAHVFASAASVAGIHGSGLTNLVFCRPNTNVFEFFAPQYVHPVYWMISSECRLNYHYLVGKGTRSKTWSGWPDRDSLGHNIHGGDLVDLDQDELAKLFRMAGL